MSFSALTQLLSGFLSGLGGLQEISSRITVCNTAVAGAMERARRGDPDARRTIADLEAFIPEGLRHADDIIARLEREVHDVIGDSAFMSAGSRAMPEAVARQRCADILLGLRQRVQAALADPRSVSRVELRSLVQELKLWRSSLHQIQRHLRGRGDPWAIGASTAPRSHLAALEDDDEDDDLHSGTDDELPRADYDDDSVDEPNSDDDLRPASEVLFGDEGLRPASHDLYGDESNDDFGGRSRRRR